MPKAKVKDILTYATENKFGVAAINTLNIETVKYVIEAAERERVPIIVQFYPGFSDYTDLKHLAFAACDMAEKASIPVGVHLDEAAVAVIGKAGVVGLFGQTLNSLIVQAEVQDGVHHAGHGLTCAGTDGNQQGVLDGAEGLTGLLLEDAHVFEDVCLDLIVDLTVVSIVLGAGLGGDGEALRNRHAGVGHLGQAGTLTTQSILHGGLVAAEGVMALFEQIQEFLAHSYLPNW